MIVLCHLRRKKVFPVGQVQEDLAALLPNLANQMRGLLSNLYLAASQAIPAEAREQDPVLDAKAAVLDQSFYRLLRLVNSLSSAEYLAAAQPAALRDADLVKLIGEVCESAGDLAEMLGIHLKFICAMERRICAVHAGAMEQLPEELRRRRAEIVMELQMSAAFDFADRCVGRTLEVLV